MENQMKIENIFVKDIYADNNFNCRLDAINPLDVVDLAKSIKKLGLQQPIVVRRCGELDTDPDNYKWCIVAGYRRFKAFQINDSETIPCIIQEQKSAFDYKTINAEENLKRKNLNLLEEARLIEHYYNSGWSRTAIANELSVSEGWVQVRCMILDFEPEIQQEFAAGLFNTSHIRDLYSIKSGDKRLQAAAALKKARERGDRARVTDVISKKKPKAMSARTRTKREIERMIIVVSEARQEFSLHTRLLGWAAGNVTDFDIHKAIQEDCANKGITYQLPEFEL